MLRRNRDFVLLWSGETVSAAGLAYAGTAGSTASSST